MCSDYSSPGTPVHYLVVVRAEDLGSPKLTNLYNVTIRLIDINDNPPQLINIAATCETGAPSDASVKEVRMLRMGQGELGKVWVGRCCVVRVGA